MAEEKENFAYDPVNYDEATLAQQKKIEQQIVTEQSLISERVDFSELEDEYAKDEVFQLKIKDLKSKYACMRKIRGDGNCFYRAFGFAYMEKLLSDPTEFKRFQAVARQSKDDLVALGFQQFTIEDFHDTFMEVIDKVEQNCSLEDLLQVFNDQVYSDYLVVYLRLLVSGYLQKEKDFFINFMEGGQSVKEFCNHEVEPMSKESDHIHIIALTSAIDVPVRIEYMDRGGDNVNAHDFPEGSSPKVTLIYRPGHYDILYTL
ncbi:unnamed protein product [Owenia fusiformis]|uniref:ubiquitinyl hydrolase 1 n=1 Tax=Owenia fusiformis TaxID=6347 RepID=A0A8S4PKA3_OWEFU|nr:unnamed protein product [Owenia fusiformis]